MGYVAEGINMNDKTLLQPGAYFFEPTGFSFDVISCACFIINDGRFLFLKKGLGRWSENMWGVPCGKVDKNESLSLAMVRELFEETGWKVNGSQLKYLGKMFIVQKDNICNLHNIFGYKSFGRFPVVLSDEHSDYGWFSEHDYSSISLIPFQLEVIDFVKDHFL